MSKISQISGQKVNVELQYNAHACCVLLTFAITSKSLVRRIVVDCHMKQELDLKLFFSSEIKKKSVVDEGQLVVL